MNDSIGIDISKDRLDAFRLGDGEHRSFGNNPAGFGQLRRWLDGPLARIVYEATGPCHGAFERACSGHLPLVKVNPLLARRFAQASGSRAKTDRVDARILALMGDAFALEPDQPADQKQHELKELRIERSALVKDRTRLLNRIKTQTLPLTKRHSKARIAQIERHLEAIDAEIEARLDEQKAGQLDILNSIPGIGRITAAAMLMPRGGNAWAQADRISGGTGTHDTPIGTVAGQGLHPGRTKVPARRALHASARGHSLQSRHEDQI
jgi:transposase